jgi:hypothetical protein
VFSAASANWLAYIALAVYPFLGLFVYRRLPPTRATLLLVLAGVMFLPQAVSIDLPLLPRLGKETMIYLTVAIGMLSMHRGIVLRAGPGRGLDLLILMMIVGTQLTNITNGDTLRYGPKVVQGMAPFEMFTAALLELLLYGFPFFFGRALFRSEKDLRDLLVALMLAGLVYTLFLSVELRLSPQLHRLTYGFHQNSFGSLKRWGGFRPMAFMDSGIAVGIFMVNTVMAAMTSVRANLTVFGWSAKLVAPYLLIFLMLCKSVASMVWGAVFTPVLLLLSPRRIATIALLLALLVGLYPTLRMTDLFPWRGIVSIADSIDPERARSLNYRFENDENMLRKVRSRFVFGWGGYSRNWAYDPETGKHLTVPDGAWIIRLSSNGAVGFYSLYGLYVLPVVLAFLRFKQIRGRQTQFMLAGLMLIVVIRAVDQLPNGLYSSYPIFLAGALYNLTRSIPREQANRGRVTRAAPHIEKEALVNRADEASPRKTSPRRTGSTAVLLGVQKDDEPR